MGVDVVDVDEDASHVGLEPSFLVDGGAGVDASLGASVVLPEVLPEAVGDGDIDGAPCGAACCGDERSQGATRVYLE